MNTATRLAVIALLLGIAGDYLVRGMPWGINALLGTLLVLAAVAFATRQAGAMIFGSVGALAAAGGIAWRDAPLLVALDVLLLAGFLACLTLRARGVREWAAGTTRVAAALLFSAALALIGIPLLFAEVQWRAAGPRPVARRIWVVLRGLLLAFVPLLIFTVLLTSADAAFASIVGHLIRINIAEVFGHVVLTLVIALSAAGFLYALSHPRALPEVPRASFLHLDAAETNVAIGLIDALFAAFVAVQFRYFFGGAALVKVAPGLTYAAYARRGFFELVAVAALVVLLLLVSEWIIDKSGGVLTFRLLALAQVLLVFVMLVSAYRRMQLYVDEFGLTEQRLYTTAFMFFLAALLAWFAATVLTGRRERFFLGAVVSGLAVVVALHVINPDALIARTNLARAAAGKRTLDVKYLTSLSADAAAPLAAAHLPCRSKQGDWRSWNLSRATAAEVCGRPLR